MSRPASSSCSSLQSGAVLGFRFLVVTRKMGAGKDGMALSFVELPELMHHLSCSSSSPSRLLLCFALLSCAQLMPTCSRPAVCQPISRAGYCVQQIMDLQCQGQMPRLACCYSLLHAIIRSRAHRVICAAVHRPMRATRLYVCLTISAPATHPPCT